MNNSGNKHEVLWIRTNIFEQKLLLIFEQELLRIFEDEQFEMLVQLGSFFFFFPLYFGLFSGVSAELVNSSVELR